MYDLEMNRITINSRKREELIDVTSEIACLIPDNSEGAAVLFARHTTCGLTINENSDPDVKHDILLFLSKTIPQFYQGFRHIEHNSDAHLKASIMGSSVTVPFANGKLLLGTWQGIYLCEFDGPRERTVIVTILS